MVRIHFVPLKCTANCIICRGDEIIQILKINICNICRKYLFFFDRVSMAVVQENTVAVKSLPLFLCSWDTVLDALLMQKTPSGGG